MDNYLKRLMQVSAVASLMVMPGCSPKKVRPDKAVCCIQKNVDETLQQNVFWKSSCEVENFSIDDIQSASLTRERAVGIALQNSTTLQAKFRDLGVAKADLEKAGLYKNPFFTTIIQFPKPNPFQIPGIIDGIRVNSYVEVDLTWNLSDLWLVPRRKKVSDDQLEITTFDIMDTIFEIRMNTINAYNKYAYAIMQADHAREVLERVKNLYENAEELRSDENFHDSQAAFVLINQMDIAVANASFERKKAWLELADAMGISAQEYSFELRDELGSVDLSALEYEVLQGNPKLIKACLKIQQEKDKRSLEKARYLEDVSVGVSYNNQPIPNSIIAGPRLLGPIISMSIPIFDNKYADIARADFLIEKAEAEYATILSALTLKAQLCKAEIEAMASVIEHYQKVLAAYEQSIEHENADPEATYAKKVKHLNTHISWFDKKNALFKSYLQLHTAIATLEQTVGKKIVS